MYTEEQLLEAILLARTPVDNDYFDFQFEVSEVMKFMESKIEVKYGVEFSCYWYNTGMADNHSYINTEKFDTLEEAQKFRDKLLWEKDIKDSYTSEKINFEEYQAYTDKFYEVENGYIEDYKLHLVKIYPEQKVIID